MDPGLVAALSACGEVLAAYRARIKELEAIVSSQQAKIASLQPPPVEVPQ